MKCGAVVTSRTSRSRSVRCGLVSSFFAIYYCLSPSDRNGIKSVVYVDRIPTVLQAVVVREICSCKYDRIASSATHEVERCRQHRSPCLEPRAIGSDFRQPRPGLVMAHFVNERPARKLRKYA